MGGTFNPIHYGHLLMCEHIREEFNLEKILFVPAKTPPHKGSAEITETEHRMEMVGMAIQDNPCFELCDAEMRMEGPSYTVETLKVLAEEYGEENRLCLIIGADSLVQFTGWKRYEEILDMADIIVARRPDTKNRLLDLTVANEGGSQCENFRFRSHCLDFSSTRIREPHQGGFVHQVHGSECVEATSMNTIFMRGNDGG